MLVLAGMITYAAFIAKATSFFSWLAPMAGVEGQDALQAFDIPDAEGFDEADPPQYTTPTCAGVSIIIVAIKNPVVLWALDSSSSNARSFVV